MERIAKHCTKRKRVETVKFAIWTLWACCATTIPISVIKIGASRMRHSCYIHLTKIKCSEQIVIVVQQFKVAKKSSIESVITWDGDLF